jgi:hypothetical protein
MNLASEPDLPSSGYPVPDFLADRFHEELILPEPAASMT